jgi:hypothetical protein
MALLPTPTKDQLWAEFMRELSAAGVEIPVNKVALRSFIDLVDTQLEAAETSVVQAIPAGTGRTWLISHPSIGRIMMARIEKARSEVL